MTPAMKRSSLIAVLAVVAALPLGCAREAVTENPMRLSVTDRDMVRGITRDVLEAMHFEVEMPPRSPDRLNTLPLVSAYPAEFWRTDTRTSYDRAESALHTVRRTVVVHLKPDDSASDKGMLVQVVATKQRPVMRQGLNAKTVNESYSVFRTRRKALDNFEEHWGQGLQWVDYGRDPGLEQYILTRIRNRL